MQYDLIIIGAGPTGLSAAIYAGREDLKVLVLDQSIVGGLAAITDVIDNYPGFEAGISGHELAERLEKQAKRFGAEIRTGMPVTGLEKTSEGISVKTASGDLTARSVIIATGSTYKQLGVPGEAELVGRGIHFCATCDGPLYRDKRLVVIGGGNSAVQETLFLAKFAANITMLVRGPELKASAILIDQIKLLENVEILYGQTTTSVTVDQGIKTVHATDANDKQVSYECDGIFVFIGLLANTEAFVDTLAHDERNFLTTDTNYASSLPGVFVAGDVRSGSTWQIAAAVGEGVSAALAVREYLAQTRLR